MEVTFEVSQLRPSVTKVAWVTPIREVLHSAVNVGCHRCATTGENTYMFGTLPQKPTVRLTLGLAMAALLLVGSVHAATPPAERAAQFYTLLLWDCLPEQPNGLSQEQLLYVARLNRDHRVYELQEYMLERASALGLAQCQSIALEACERNYPGQCKAAKPEKPLPPLPDIGVPVFLPRPIRSRALRKGNDVPIPASQLAR